MHKQLSKTGVAFEIRVYDDASTQRFETETFLQDFPEVVYKRQDKNSGRLAIRYRLAQDAQYDWLLFMDADVFPADRFFVSKLLKSIENTEADVYFGGVKVSSQPPAPDQTLRWKYGMSRENKALNERQKTPYKSLLCGTLCFKKNVFLSEAEIMLPINKYGLDVLFSYRLKKNQRKIHHYNNQVTHLGLENNQVFINKTQSAMETFKFLIDENFMSQDYATITATAYKIKQKCPAGVCRFVFRLASPLLKLNLLGKHPSLKLFDLYKLLYFSQLK